MIFIDTEVNIKRKIMGVVIPENREMKGKGETEGLFYLINLAALSECFV